MDTTFSLSPKKYASRLLVCNELFFAIKETNNIGPVSTPQIIHTQYTHTLCKSSIRLKYSANFAQFNLLFWWFYWQLNFFSFIINNQFTTFTTSHRTPILLCFLAFKNDDNYYFRRQIKSLSRAHTFTQLPSNVFFYFFLIT